MESGSGEVGYGEIAPLSGFGTETLDDAENWLTAHESGLEDSKIVNIPENLRCVQFAVESARDMICGKESEQHTTVDNAALLSPGFRCLKGLNDLIEAG